MLPMTLHPGEHTCLDKGHARGLTIHPGSWHIEYGRGAVVTTLPFAMVDTLFLSAGSRVRSLVDHRVQQAGHQAISPLTVRQGRTPI
jgi:hypothetical protein